MLLAPRGVAEGGTGAGVEGLLGHEGLEAAAVAAAAWEVDGAAGGDGALVLLQEAGEAVAGAVTAALGEQVVEALVPQPHLPEDVVLGHAGAVLVHGGVEGLDLLLVAGARERGGARVATRLV